MKYEDIKDFNRRCETHPDHQTGMVSNEMLLRRLHEEIEELRSFIENDVVKEAEHVYVFGWNSALEMVAYQISQMRAFPSDTRESFGVFVKQHRKGLH